MAVSLVVKGTAEFFGGKHGYFSQDNNVHNDRTGAADDGIILYQ